MVFETKSPKGRVSSQSPALTTEQTHLFTTEGYLILIKLLNFSEIYQNSPREFLTKTQV